MTNVLLGFSYGEQAGVCNIFVKNKYLVVSSDYLSKIQHKIPGQKKKKKKADIPLHTSTAVVGLVTYLEDKSHSQCRITSATFCCLCG